MTDRVIGPVRYPGDVPQDPPDGASARADLDTDITERDIAALISERRFGEARSSIESLLIDAVSDFEARSRILVLLASALDGLGDVEAARGVLLEAVATADRTGDIGWCSRIALEYAIPSDWHQPSLLGVSTLKQLAERAIEPEDRALTRSARALVELRVPSATGDEGVLRWRSQPTLARRLADEAVSAARSSSTVARAAAALAWRSTHRSPEFVDLRRQRSDEVFALAHDSDIPGLQIEGALWRCVDALEQGDRSGFDEAISIGVWVAEATGNPRHRWRMAIAAHTAAFLAENRNRAEELWDEIRRCAIGAPAVSPLMNELYFPGLWLLDSEDPAVIAELTLPEGHPALEHPIGMAMAAEVLARTNDPERARTLVEQSLTHLDLEAGYLFQLARIARVVVHLGDSGLARRIITLLTPWESLVAIDSDAWGCEPPVAAVLAEMYLVLGDHGSAARLAHAARDIAASIGHRPALRRIAAVLDACARADGAVSSPVELTDRELEVLRRLALGGTNPGIAAELNYSLSTIRRDTTIIYRKLGAANRPDAVNRALALGLIDPSDTGRT